VRSPSSLSSVELHKAEKFKLLSVPKGAEAVVEASTEAGAKASAEAGAGVEAVADQAAARINLFGAIKKGECYGTLGCLSFDLSDLIVAAEQNTQIFFI
jgi:hypothetical protein